ncbi:MAG: hydroxyacid dehydrogenase [Candidatus Micrarchaeota archaeon]|nr:hydroxyacid dehydrogenase [Candidatus Micrarchaeota archaeon]
MPNILIANPEYFDEQAVKILKSAGDVTARTMSRSELERSIHKFDAIVLRVDTKLDRKLLSRAKRLKVIGSATTGLGHIDTEYAAKHGIKIIGLHGAHTTSTAEHTMALMLSLARKVPWAFESMKQGRWKRAMFIGAQLEGRTLGIIGVGRIGSRVAEHARGFGMKVMGYDPYASPKGVRMVNLERLLKDSDIVTLHPVLTGETRHMISLRQLRMMKRTALLVNTSRGEVVNSRDLIHALKSGIIAGAALDVFPEEPLTGIGNMFAREARRLDTLIITPHLGASTREAIHRAGAEIAAKVGKALAEGHGQ